jgi:gluconate 2-dehydrogenase gamma chain
MNNEDKSPSPADAAESQSATPRRNFLIGSSVLATAATLGIPFAKLTASEALAAASPSLETYQPAFFKDAEMKFISAACDRLIPADDVGPGALKANVPVFIDQQMITSYGKGEDWYMEGPHDAKAPGYFGYQQPFPLQDLYRRGIAALDKHCQKTFQKSFVDLEGDVQDQVLTHLQKGEINFAEYGETVLPAKEFFSYLLQHTKEGYLADPIYGGNKGMEAWKMINFPGARASFLEWVGQHNVHYPLGPVSLSGEKA